MKEHDWLKKGMRMNTNRFGKRLAFAAGFIFLCAAPGRTSAQSSPPSPPSASSPSSAPIPMPAPRKRLPAARPKTGPGSADDFAGLEYTDDQKAKIDKIHADMKVRLDAVAQDGKLTPEQRDAMLEGYKRMERSQVFKALTPEQQKEVLKRARARHVAEEGEQKKRQPPPPPK
jgi:Spy/CpxP family protein refolding chaperone